MRSASDWQEFNRRTFTVAAYDPPTGIGRFGFKYDHAAKTIDVKVLVSYDYIGPAVGNDYLNWTFTDRANFKKKATQVISDAWTNKYKLVCKDPDWSDLFATVSIGVQETSKNNAHYIVECRNQLRSAGTAFSGGCNHGAGVARYTANFSNWGLEERAEFGGEHIFNFKEKQITDRLKNRGLDVITMADGSAQVPNAVVTELTAFVREVKQIMGTDQLGLNCVIYGCSTELIGHKRADERATALYNLLNPQIPNFFVVDRSPAAKAKAQQVAQANNAKFSSHSGAILYIDVSATSLRKVLTNYIVITHEFGHMLGCPDEYTGVNCSGIKAMMDLNDLVPNSLRTGPAAANVNPLAPGQHFKHETPSAASPANVARLQEQQKAFARQIQKAGVQSPTFMTQGTTVNDAESKASSAAWFAERARLKAKYGPDSKQYNQFNQTNVAVLPKTGATDSIMYTGQKILAAHYLPIWSCLTELTRDFVPPSSWAIEPV